MSKDLVKIEELSYKKIFQENLSKKKRLTVRDNNPIIGQKYRLKEFCCQGAVKNDF